MEWVPASIYPYLQEYPKHCTQTDGVGTCIYIFIPTRVPKTLYPNWWSWRRTPGYLHLCTPTRHAQKCDANHCSSPHQQDIPKKVCCNLTLKGRDRGGGRQCHFSWKQHTIDTQVSAAENASLTFHHLTDQIIETFVFKILQKMLPKGGQIGMRVHQRIQGPGPPCPHDSFLLLQFSGNFKGKILVWVHFGLRPPPLGSKLHWGPLD